ncbi:Hexapep domain-containing protein/SATase_N domain-containing protein [Cephalotus follicularis]|uniref:serine O-acetyltransferase n=1 Tax=Cephalotus follicularis TaxID=3775 RepID=A0A1Q3DAJ8_CEPFO|nr:Hexapep domain-containing protein/SATase_N domain-containing protein [Cephalotus follicularis]
MACLSDESWGESLPTMLSERLSFNEEDKNGEANMNLMEFPFEKLFPVYAMGALKPLDQPDSVTLSDPIWDAVREEAKLEAEKEPILSSFLYASILSHDCLEQALGFVLADRLQNPTLLATELMDIFCDVIMSDRGMQHSIRQDVKAFKDRDPACLSYCSALLYLKGYHSLQSYRVAHALWNQGRKVLALALQSRISEVFGVDIHPAAKIGEAILLDHGTGVVIGETAVVGNRVSLMHGVTLGGTGKEIGDRHPKVGEGALIGACAIILGNINIGDGAMIASGSLVLKEVPPHSMVAGTPAKVIGYVDEQNPSLTMNHASTMILQMLLKIFSNMWLFLLEMEGPEELQIKNTRTSALEC